MLCIYSTWILESPPKFSVPILHVIPCSPSKTVHTFSTQLSIFLQDPTAAKCWLFIDFSLLKQSYHLMTEICLPHILSVLLHLVIMYHNNVPFDDFQQTTRLVTVQCTGCLVIQEFKMSGHYLHPNSILVVCVQPGHCECSADISYPPIWRLVSFGALRHELICAHTAQTRLTAHAQMLLWTLWIPTIFFIRMLACINSSYYGKIQNIAVT